MQVRPYVTGKVLWAALTARLTQIKGRGDDGAAYRDIGESITQNFRFGYLWPAIYLNRNHDTNQFSVYYPWESDDFDYLFLDSYVSTAINCDLLAVEQGSLHEVEYIANKTRQGEQVFLAGYLWKRKDLPESIGPWREALESLRIGGERHYGWGRVKLHKCDAVNEAILDPDKFFWEGIIPAHAMATDELSEITQGDLEPFGGWEMGLDGQSKVGEMLMAFTPGSMIKPGKDFRIGANGIWELIS
jgi:hypothetical protein